MSEKKRLAKNTLLIAIGNFGAKMVSFLLLPLYTTLLSSSEYGQYDFIITVNVLIIPLVTFSMHEALFRFIIDTKKENKDFKVIVSNALVSVIFGIICMRIIFVLLFIVLYIVVDDYAETFLYLFLITASNSLFLFSNNLLRGLGRIKEYAIISCLKNVIQLALNVVVITVLKLGINGLFISLVISDMIAFITVCIYARLWKYVDIKSVNKKELLPMVKYALPLVPNALCAQIIHLSDRFVIIWFLGSSANGIYSISYKFPSIIETIYHYFYTAWGESASRVFANNEDSATDYYQSLHGTINSFVFSSVIVLIACMPVLFRILIRGNYVDGFKYVPILLLSVYFDCMAKFYSGIFTAIKKTSVMATTTIISAIINIVINILLIRKMGLYAAAGSTLLAEILLAVLRKLKLRHYVRFEYSMSKTLSMLMITILILLLYSYDNIVKICFSIIIAVTYFVFSNKKVISSVIKEVIYKVQKAQ